MKAKETQIGRDY